jgi:DNA (cytosine-5)-methyltransferase 1
MARRYNVISLFSGAMGLDLGLERTGRFRVIACIEKDKASCDTIRANLAAGRLHPKLQVYEADICQLDPLHVLADCGLCPGEVDLLVGGPPCQPFSTAGKRGTARDARGTLQWDFLRFVEAMRPRFFIMENVRGLLSAALRHRPMAQRPERGGPPLDPDEMPGSVVRLFASDLGAIEGNPYHMDCFEVNAVNYGAPQLRERAIFVGNRYSAAVDFPNPTHGPNPSEYVKPWRTLRDAIVGIDKSGDVVMDFSPRKKSYLSLVPPGSNWRSLPLSLQRESMGKAWAAKGGRSGWWRRLSFDLPCPTLVTMPNHASTALCHPTEVRALSMREYAAIQEFPSDWEFCGTPGQQYAQIGNAVPLKLGEIAGATVAEKLDALRKRRWKPYVAELGSYRIVYIQSHVRTRQWFKDGTTFVWADGAESNEASYRPPRTLRKASAISPPLT